MASIIIGLSGKKRSGKNTVAEHLVNNHGFTLCSIADPIRNIAKSVFPTLTDDMVLGNGYDREQEFYNGLSVRKILQMVGSDMFRDKVGSNVWIDNLRERIKGLPEDSKVVISDVRFPNEVEGLREMGGKVVRVIRTDYVDIDLHISEIALDTMELDAEVEAKTGDFDALYRGIEKILQSL